MKTKKEIQEWILENCTDEFGDIDLSNLDFAGIKVMTLGMVAKEIDQTNHKAIRIDNSEQQAEYIENNHQYARSIDNRFQQAKAIYNENQLILPPQRKVVEYSLTEEEQAKLDELLANLRK